MIIYTILFLLGLGIGFMARDYILGDIGGEEATKKRRTSKSKLQNSTHTSTPNQVISPSLKTREDRLLKDIPSDHA